MAMNDVTQEQAFDFARATPKWVWNASGQLVEVPVDQPAYDHDPVTGEPLGVLIEPTRTNNFPSNHDLASSLTYASAPGAGNTTRLNISSTDIGIPGVSLTADSDGVVGASFYNTLVPVDENYALSAYIKPKTASSVRMGTNTSAGGNSRVWVVLDVSTEEVTVTTSVSGGTGGAKSVGNGWWWLWVTRPSIESGTGAGHFSAYATGLSAGEDIEVAGVNAEIGRTPSSYIPTAGAPVTRAADTMTRSLGAEWNPSAGTFFLDYDESDNGSVFGAYGPDNTNTGVMVYRSSPTGRVSLYVETDGQRSPITSTQSSDSSRPLEPRRVAVSLDAVSGSVILTVDGASRATTSEYTSTALAYITRFWFNSGRPREGTSNAANPFRNFRYYPYAMTAAELEALTTPTV